MRLGAGVEPAGKPSFERDALGTAALRGTPMFSTRSATITAPAEASRSLQAWVLAMLIAPFVPWYTFPIPFVILLIGGFVYLPVALLTGPPQPAAGLIAFAVLGILATLLVVSGIFTFLYVRRRNWQSALWSALVNMGSGGTLLGALLLSSGVEPIEPFGYVSPLAFLTLAAVPASYGIAVRWLRELGERSGSKAEQAARLRFLVVSLGYAAVFTTSAIAIAVSAAAAIQGLGVPRFYYDVQTIRASAAETFAGIGLAALSGYLIVTRFLIRPELRS